MGEAPPAELHARANTIAQTAIGKATDLQWAVHWNHARSNLHIHVIFSERQREKDAGRWDRDIYLTEDGKVARRRADRAKNPDGTDKPPVHRKGEEKGGFTAKDKTYTTKGWLADTKERLKQTFTERWGSISRSQTICTSTMRARAGSSCHSPEERGHKVRERQA